MLLIFLKILLMCMKKYKPRFCIKFANFQSIYFITTVYFSSFDLVLKFITLNGFIIYHSLRIFSFPCLTFHSPAVKKILMGNFSQIKACTNCPLHIQL